MDIPSYLHVTRNITTTLPFPATSAALVPCWKKIKKSITCTFVEVNYIEKQVFYKRWRRGKENYLLQTFPEGRILCPRLWCGPVHSERLVQEDILQSLIHLYFPEKKTFLLNQQLTLFLQEGFTHLDVCNKRIDRQNKEKHEQRGRRVTFIIRASLDVKR